MSEEKRGLMVLWALLAGLVFVSCGGPQPAEDLSFESSLLKGLEQPFTVESYYLLMPRSIIPVPPEKKRELIASGSRTEAGPELKRTVIVDRENGYLRI